MNRQEVFDWCRQRYGSEPDYPWNDWRKNSCASLASARTGLRSFVPTIGRFSILTGGITNIMRMAAIISNSLQQMRRNRM